MTIYLLMREAGKGPEPASEIIHAFSSMQKCKEFQNANNMADKSVFWVEKYEMD
jgi:hypothetical protein